MRLGHEVTTSRKRLGKREREMRREAFKVRSDIIDANIAAIRSGQLSAERSVKRASDGSLLVVKTGLRSSADPTLLKSSTRYGYRDNLHGNGGLKVNPGSCRVGTK